jgi:hypothetical protein
MAVFQRHVTTPSARTRPKNLFSLGIADSDFVVRIGSVFFAGDDLPCHFYLICKLSPTGKPLDRNIKSKEHFVELCNIWALAAEYRIRNSSDLLLNPYAIVKRAGIFSTPDLHYAVMGGASTTRLPYGEFLDALVIEMGEMHSNANVVSCIETYNTKSVGLYTSEGALFVFSNNFILNS